MTIDRMEGHGNYRNCPAQADVSATPPADCTMMVMQEALRISEQSYRLLIEDAPYAICRSTTSGQLLQANRAMQEMLGYKSGYEQDLLVRDLPFIYASPEEFEALRQSLLEEGVIQGREGTWICRDQKEVQILASGRAVRGPTGEVEHFDIIAENITERKQLEARLRQAEKMQAIGQLAGGVAHDFNNLLTVISLQIEEVLGHSLVDDVRESLVDVKQATERAADLTRQLLAFSRQQVLISKVLNLNEVIERLRQMLSRLIRENIALRFLPEPNLWAVRADPNQLERVLLNLALNAQDAMPDGGQLTIETSNLRFAGDASPSGQIDPGEYILITVTDTGHGMDEETKAHIFEPFFTTKKPGQGTGLGLSMVYGIVKQSDGHVRVESYPGVGSTFKIYLPRVSPLEQVGTGPVATTTPHGQETVLVAEDEEAVRRIVAEQLRRLGYRVLMAADGLEAANLAHSFGGRIDLLITDLIMPNMGGRELAAELRKSEPWLKVIYISGYAGRGVAGQGVEVLDAPYIQKPFSIQQLATKIREVVDGTGKAKGAARRVGKRQGVRSRAGTILVKGI